MFVKPYESMKDELGNIVTHCPVCEKAMKLFKKQASFEPLKIWCLGLETTLINQTMQHARTSGCRLVQEHLPFETWGLCPPANEMGPWTMCALTTFNPAIVLPTRSQMPPQVSPTQPQPSTPPLPPTQMPPQVSPTPTAVAAVGGTGGGRGGLAAAAVLGRRLGGLAAEPVLGRRLGGLAAAAVAAGQLVLGFEHQPGLVGQQPVWGQRVVVEPQPASAPRPLAVAQPPQPAHFLRRT